MEFILTAMPVNLELMGNYGCNGQESTYIWPYSVIQPINQQIWDAVEQLNAAYSKDYL